MNTDALGAAPDFQLHPEVCKHKGTVRCFFLNCLPSSAPGKGNMFALLMLDLKYY